MGNKIYHLITYDVLTDEIVEILNFHKRENAVAVGREYIKEWYESLNSTSHSLEEFYKTLEETGTFYNELEIAESEFED